MIKKSFDCDNCGMFYSLSYDEENAIQEPTYCPYCAENHRPEKGDELELDDDYFQEE